MANIQFLTAGSVDTARPMNKPIMAVSDDRKLKTKARPKDSPLVNKMAKSPTIKKYKVVFLYIYDVVYITSQ